MGSWEQQEINTLKITQCLAVWILQQVKENRGQPVARSSNHEEEHYGVKRMVQGKDAHVTQGENTEASMHNEEM